MPHQGRSLWHGSSIRVRMLSQIRGTAKVKNLEENIGALSVEWSKEELKEIENAAPHEDTAAPRYAEAMMAKTWRFN